MRKAFLMMVLFLFLFPVTVFAEEMPLSITVQGTGRVTVVPDLATISFAVAREGKEAGEVQKGTTEDANTVKAALLEAGLPEEHFQTAGIQLYTNYDYSSDVEKIVGYRGQISMSVNEIDVDEVGKYLQILSENGVNQIDGITVFFSGYDDAYQEALGKAMLQARQKAEALANAENAEVTARFSAQEGYQNDSLRSREKNLETDLVMAAAEDSASGSLDFTVGTTEVEANVTVCYEIKAAGSGKISLLHKTRKTKAENCCVKIPAAGEAYRQPCLSEY